MRALPRSNTRLLLGVVLAGLGASAAAQDTGTTTDRPFIFFTPGLAVWNRDSDHDAFFDSIDTTLVIPFAEQASAVTTFSLQFRDKPQWTSAANYDWPVNRDTTLRVSAGLVDDCFGARLTAYQEKGEFGTGLRMGVVRGDFEVGGFVSAPLAWGFPLRNESMSDRLRGRDRVTRLGARTAASFSVRNDEIDLSTEPFYMRPRNADWPRLGQGPQGAGDTTAWLPLALHEAWISQTGGPVASSAAIAEDTVYVGSGDGYLYALKLATGELRWRYRLGSPVRSSPAVAHGKVFVGCDDGALYCLSAEADPRLAESRLGSQLWRYRTGGSVAGSPLVTVSGLAIIGSTDGTLYALDAKSGRPAWTYQTAGSLMGSPVRSEGQVAVAVPGQTKAVQRDAVYCASQDGSLYAFDERNGALLWRVTTGAPVVGSPAVSQGLVIVANQAGRVLAVRAPSGREAWSQTVAGEVLASPTASGERLIVPIMSGKLAALELATGSPVWTAEVPGEVASTPAASGSRALFVGSTDGHLYSLDLRSGEVAWSAATDGAVTASPAIADGKVVIGSQGGAIYAFADRAPAGGVARQTLTEEARSAAAAPAATSDAATHPALPPLTPTAPAWSPPPGWLKPAPSTETRDGPAATESAATASQPPAGIGMRLISEPADPSELPIQLTTERTTIVSWGTTAPSAEVDGESVRNEGGQVKVTKSFPRDGTYPVTLLVGKGTREEVMLCRLVIVDTGAEPVATREVAFSPDDDGLGDTIAFRAFAHSAGGRSIATRTVDIRHPSGEPVRTWSASGQGEDAFIWDGRDLTGQPVPAGRYVVLYSASDKTGHTRTMRQTVIVQRAGERLAVW